MPQPYGDDMTAEETGVGARHDWTETKEALADRAGEVASEAKKGARRIADEAEQGLRDAKRTVARAYDRTTETAERAYRGARGYATENPAKAAAVTFAAGVGVGMMLAPRNGRHSYGSYGRGLVPVVAMALAHAVLDVFDRAR